MLVLNRRPGESVIIEPDVHVTVLSVADRRVRISLRAPGVPTLQVSAVVVAADQARVEIGPLASVAFDGRTVHMTTAPPGHPASDAQAALAINCSVGERVDVGDGVWVAVTSVSKGNPCVAFGGSAIGEELRITLIRPAGSYVRLGVEAPNRRVYREELWAAMQAAGALDEQVGRFDGRMGGRAPVGVAAGERLHGGTGTPPSALDGGPDEHGLDGSAAPAALQAPAEAPAG